MTTFKQITSILGVAALAVAMSNCTALRQANSKNKESLLAAAGYTQIPAKTAQQQANLQAMPPYKQVQRSKGGKTYYTYADAKRNVLYVGSPSEYQYYKKLGLQQSMQNDEILMENDDMAESMNWGMWAPWY